MVSLLPKDQRFFELYEQMTTTIAESAIYLESLLENLADLEVRLIRLKELEHEGDVITHETTARLDKTFLTPFDREDLHALTSNLDDVLDWIEEAGQSLAIYRVNTGRDDARRLARIITRTTQEIQTAVEKLRDHKKHSQDIRRCLVEINRLENEGDLVFRQAMSALFEEEGLDPILIMKWKEIYEALEQAIDAGEKVAHTIDSILVKHA